MIIGFIIQKIIYNKIYQDFKYFIHINIIKSFNKYLSILSLLKENPNKTFLSDSIMTQQNINIKKSSDKIRDSFISHFKKAFFLKDIVKKILNLRIFMNF